MSVDRKFLVVSDESDECASAARFAGMRAKVVGAGLVILRVARGSGFGHWRGLDEEMGREAREAAMIEARRLAEDVEAYCGQSSEIVIKDGDALDAIRGLTASDPTIKVLVLGSGTGRKGPGPLVTRLGRGKPLADRPLAVTVVPGQLNDEELAEMGGMT
ncbi:MAG: universal stress protein [Pseudomonadota bacterium]